MRRSMTQLRLGLNVLVSGSIEHVHSAAWFSHSTVIPISLLPCLHLEPRPLLP